MKKIVCLLILMVLSSTSLKAYGKDFGNNDGNVRISLPRFVNYKDTKVFSEMEKVNIVNREESYSNEYISVNIYKPEVHILNNIKSQEAINLKINTIIDEFKNRVLEDSKRDNEFNKTNGLPIKQYVVNVNNTIHYNRNDILSLTLHLYSYMGGAHGSTKDISLNIDTNTGNNGSLKDFLGNNEGYDEIILNEIKRQVNINPEMYFKESVDKITKLPYNQNFFLIDDNIVVYFDEYEIAPYVAGRPEFIIPLSKFPNGLNKVNINEESPIITTLLMEYEDANLRYNQYICLPQLECYSLSKKYEKINGDLKSNIFNDIEVIGKEDGAYGVTSYFIPFYEDKDTILISITYILASKAERDIKVIKNYEIDLCKKVVLQQ